MNCSSMLFSYHFEYTFGTAAARLAKKLLQLRHHLFELRRQIRSDHTSSLDAALARIQELNAMEDTRPLEPGEVQERRICRDEVAELDMRLEMDWCQRFRQIWLAARDANTRFFHHVTNGRRQQNHVRRLRIDDRIHSDETSVGQAL